MVLWEIEQIANEANLTTDFFSTRLERISRYFDMLTGSFTIMREGMDMGQYLKFRRTLSPASGFQSAQYRMIEFGSTHVENLIDARYREKLKDEQSDQVIFEHLYYQLLVRQLNVSTMSLQ